MSFCVAFTGGGTGGHIYPGLAVADELTSICKENNIFDCRIVWIGSSKGMDRNIVESSSIVNNFYGIPSGKLRRYFSFQNFIDFFKIIAGFLCAFFILLKIKPVALFSKGGFVSVPPCVAARLLGIPVYTHECDFSPGLATKLNSHFASRILVSYQETSKYFATEKQKLITVTGNPVRPVFYSPQPEIGRKFLGLEAELSSTDSKPVLLVIGGSLGARQINQLVFDNLEFLCKHFIVVHQTGKNNQVADDFSAKVEGIYKSYPFIYEQMPHVMACSDVILSRAGANSIWECAVLGKPMILIPLCGSGTRGDQLENAQFFKDKGAALVLEKEEADSEHLIMSLQQMLDKDKRKVFAKCASELSSEVFAAKNIAELIFMETLKK